MKQWAAMVNDKQSLMKADCTVVVAWHDNSETAQHMACAALAKMLGLSSQPPTPSIDGRYELVVADMVYNKRVRMTLAYCDDSDEYLVGIDAIDDN